MALYPKPHSAEWFTALQGFNPQQAAATRQVLKSAGREDVCSVCGDDPASELKIFGDKLPANAVASIRLCDDCRRLRGSMHGENYEPLVS
jgi:hypothetical protein